MRTLLVLALAAFVLGCGEKSKADEMSDQDIRKAQERVKELERSSPAPK